MCHTTKCRTNKTRTLQNINEFFFLNDKNLCYDHIKSMLFLCKYPNMGPPKTPVTSEWNILSLNQIVIIVEKSFL